MEEKINIAEILKDKPEGTELWTDMFGSVTLYVVTDVCDAFQVKHHNKEPWFDKDGKLYKEGFLCIYPSKSMRDWTKFAWKKGDILVNKDGNVHIIFEGFENDTYKTFHGKNYLWEEGGSIVNFEEDEDYMQTSEFNKANKEDAQEYIHKIEKELGGKLNMETLEIEKPQPEFKDGDILCVIDSSDDYHYILIYKGQDDKHIYRYVTMFENNSLHIRKDAHLTKPKDYSMRYATEEEKQQLFDALAKKDKAWDAEKKQIVDLKPKCEFKPFDKVLGRNEKDDVWEAELFSYYREESQYPFRCIGFGRKYCIPYNEETAHLLGTTDDWEGGEQ